MNITPTIVTTNFRITGTLPPTPDYKWDRNITVNVLADTIDIAIDKFRAAYPENKKIISVHKSTDVHIV